MSLYDEFFRTRDGREYTVHYGGPLRDAVLGMSVEEVYRTQPELQAVVSFIARNVAQLPLKCYMRVSDEDRPRDTDGVLPRLLADPGGGVTTYDLVLWTISDVCIYGRYLWWVLPSADTETGWAIQHIPAGWVAQTKTRDGFRPSSYVLRNPTTTGREIEVPADQFVSHVEYNPGRPVTPLSPVDALKQVLAEQASSREYRNKVWRNGGWFSRWIKRPKDAPDWSQNGGRARFAKSWKSRFAGKDGTDTGGTPLLEDGMELMETRLNAKEAEWAESMRLSREDVAAAYHVNPAQVWSNDGQTYASVKENARSLYSDTLGPYLTMMRADIERRLVPMIGADPRSYAEFDLTAKLAGSFEEQASFLSQSTGGPWMLRNEARARMNLPAVDGGDELIVPMNVVEGGLANPHDTAPDKSAVPVAYIEGGVLYALPGAAKGAGPRTKGAPARACPRKGRSAAMRAAERELAEVLRAFYERQAESVAGAVAGTAWGDYAAGGSQGTIWRGKARWVSELAEDLALAAGPQAEAAARSVLRELSPEGDLDAGKVADAITSLCESRSDQIVQSTFVRLTEDIDALWSQGEESWTPDAVRSCVAESYGSLMDSRVGRNSSSMATAVNSAGTMEGARQSGVSCMKEWVHNPSKAPRSSHVALDGQRVPIDGTFTNGAMWPGDASLPASESCECHCTIEIISGKDRAGNKALRKYRKDVAAADKALNKARAQYQRGNKTPERFQDTVGRAVESYATNGRTTAEWKTNPLGKELVAAARCSANGHDVEFFHTDGDGRQPDIRLDGRICEFKRPESFVPRAVYTLIKKANRQGAEGVVVDLALDRITLADALEHAERAVSDGLMEKGAVLILDWHGGEHVI